MSSTPGEPGRGLELQEGTSMYHAMHRPLATLAAAVAALAALSACDTLDATAPDAPVATVEVTAPSQSLAVGDTVRLVAVAWGSGGVPLSGRTFAWNSTDTLRAVVDATGLVRARSAGPVVIRASTGGRSGQAQLQVTPPPSPPAPTPVLALMTPSEVLERSGDLQLAVGGSGFRAGSRVLWNEIPLVTTRVSDSVLTAVVPAALTGHPQQVSVTVETVQPWPHTARPRSAARTLQVRPRPLASLDVTLAANYLFVGQALEYQVRVRNDLGEVVPPPSFQWNVGNAAVLDMDWMGQLRAKTPGQTSVRFQVGGLFSDVHLTVGYAPFRDLIVEARPLGVSELFVLSMDSPLGQRARFDRILPVGTRSAEPAVNRAGTRIAFSGTADDGSVNIWTVNMDGSGLVRLTSDALRADQPAWSPDGTRIAFRSFRSGTPRIWVMNADGSNPVPLLNPDWAPAPMNETPVWSPDGTRVVFSRSHSIHGGAQSLMSVRVNGGLPATSIEEVIHVPGHDALRPTWHPDADVLAFELRNRTTGVTQVMMASPTTGQLLHPLFPPSPGAERPALLGQGWIAVIAPRGLGGSTVPTLRIQQYNGTGVALPIPAEVGRIVGAMLALQ
ncbi:MAG: hypothetical protein EA350_08290 [Gemmatimonadales bacterium]|nr:MAG: hypothetical protein EA350_08290 [Gemmatimonadales bacterium]